MARKATVTTVSITDQLLSKQEQFLFDAENANGQADFYSEQIGLLRKGAEVSNKQAAAIASAVEILTKAGVVL